MSVVARSLKKKNKLFAAADQDRKGREDRVVEDERRLGGIGPDHQMGDLNRVGFFFSSRGRHTRWPRDWSSDVCSSDPVIKRYRIGALFCGVTGVNRARPPKII